MSSGGRRARQKARKERPTRWPVMFTFDGETYTSRSVLEPDALAAFDDARGRVEGSTDPDDITRAVADALDVVLGESSAGLFAAHLRSLPDADRVQHVEQLRGEILSAWVSFVGALPAPH